LDDILRAGWAQFGFAMAFAAAGWYMFYLLWKERKAEHARFYDLLAKTIATETAFGDTLRSVCLSIDKTGPLLHQLLALIKAQQEQGGRRPGAKK